MHLRTLELEEFRSYRRLRLALDRRGLRLSGPNASGKSTLLEAVMMLATTRSPRSSAEREVINWASGAEIGFPPFARILGDVAREIGDVEVEITLQADPIRPGLVRKQVKLNGRPVRAMDAVGALKAVLFAPDDVTLIAGPPSGRRRYLDVTISQLDGGYLRALSRYNRVLEQRNSLLKSLARARASPKSPAVGAQLAFWDEGLVAFGSDVVARRYVVVRRLGTLAGERFGWMTGGGVLQVGYRPSLDFAGRVDQPDATPVVAVQAVVGREFMARLEEVRSEEVRRGVSVVGPHRDDLAFAADGIEMGTYGSRGQQRLAVVALKLAEADLMTEVAHEPPVLLLDDVLSELDASHRALLTGTTGTLGPQVIVTATDATLLSGADLAPLPRGTVDKGVIAGG